MRKLLNFEDPSKCRLNLETVMGKDFLMCDPTCSFDVGHEGDHSWEPVRRAYGRLPEPAEKHP